MKKKVLTAFALLVFVAESYAQNTATLNQVGTNQTSHQSQSGANLISTVTQGSNPNNIRNKNNQMQTDQSGSYQIANVLQDYGSAYNQATIVQKGGGPLASLANSAAINQASNSGGTTFRSTSPGLGIVGTGNYGTIFQQGAGNASVIDQQIYSSGNYGSIDQYGTGNRETSISQSKEAEGNNAQIRQGSLNNAVSDNRAAIAQEKQSFFNDAQIDQSSHGNTAEIWQRSSSSYNTATISQQGTNSQAKIEQSYTSSENKATLTQHGNNNKGTIEQQSTSGGSAVGNTATLYQQGNNNLITSILQNYFSSNNKAYLNQYGNNNKETRISQLQSSNNNTATINMGGDGPTGQYPNGWIPVNNGTAVIDQSINSHDNIARIGQSGDGHNAQIYQTLSVSNSNAYVDQYPAGSANTALIRQTRSTASQTSIVQNQNSFGGGNGNNLAEVFQGSYEDGLSSGNITSVIQEKLNNISRNQQIGANNMAMINQSGNGNIVAGLNADTMARQIGSDNKLYISQTGTGNAAHVIQAGSGNMLMINQSSN
ncbi:hypothetical protein [Spirosoma validum]|uniref:Curlin associated repeat-containing protein n=1 Tax=Spirosoma validum TaxID=2771355 RepID=A0A927GD39_9BACT|nr:hypothetical protein [Spirosoma validum]MBD2753146.1 hypothetical protein [Spirosoma validum]